MRCILNVYGLQRTVCMNDSNLSSLGQRKLPVYKTPMSLQQSGHLLAYSKWFNPENFSFSRTQEVPNGRYQRCAQLVIVEICD